MLLVDFRKSKSRYFDECQNQVYFKYLAEYQRDNDFAQTRDKKTEAD